MISQQSHKPHSDSVAATPKPAFKTMQSARNTTAFRSIFDAGELKSELENSGVKPSLIPYIWKRVIQNPDAQFDQIPSLPSAAYPLLTSKFKTLTSSVHKVMDSSDQLTTKLLIKLQNGALVEAVIMRYDSRLGKYDGKPRPGGPRSTLCVSSQVGCKMGCTFCATGSMGFKSNLTSGEIVEQLVHASRISPIRNIVFMGMGEPLNNYGSLVEAIHVMTGSPFHLSPKKITVSTVGIIHAIKKLHSDLPGLNLAVSLHAPVQEIRCQIMPAARAFPLVKLMDTLQEYQKSTQQKIFIEYIMLDGVNDEEQHAHQLGKLLETFQVVINLIPFNPIGILSKFTTSNENKVTNFQKILRGTYGIRTTVRKEMGQDISGACGQLVVNLPNKRSTENTLTDIEDIQSSNLATSPSPSPSPSPAVGMPTPNDHGVSKGKGIVKKERRGSYPATCHSKCNECEPCMPVQVSVRAMVLEENKYYPQVWRCACSDSIFSP